MLLLLILLLISYYTSNITHFLEICRIFVYSKYYIFDINKTKGAVLHPKYPFPPLSKFAILYKYNND